MTSPARKLTNAVFCTLFATTLASAVDARIEHGEETIRKLVRDDLRVASTGLRLAVANVDRCSKRMPATGLVLHSIAQYQRGWRQAALRHFGAIEDVSVEAVVAQSPAAHAGIESRDAIIAINGLRLQRPTSQRDNPTGARDRAEEHLTSLPPTARITLSISRDGSAMELIVVPLAACKTRFEMVAGSGRFALSNGRVIQVGQGLVEAVSDTDLAVIIAHELAHTILEHRSRLAGLAHSNDLRSRERRSELGREFEEQADRLSVHLLARAGFDPRSAPDFMRRVGRGFDRASGAGSSHGTASKRTAAMDDEIARMGSTR